MKTLYAIELQRRLDHRIRIADARNAVSAWRESQSDDELADSYLATQLGERLGVLLEFLAKAPTPDALAARSWCLLYAVRPDLVDYESIQTAADRLGISQQRLCQLLKLFKTATGFVYANRVGRCSPDKQRKAIDAMAAARSAMAEARRRLHRFSTRQNEEAA
jgi:hypothetical protein